MAAQFTRLWIHVGHPGEKVAFHGSLVKWHEIGIMRGNLKDWHLLEPPRVISSLNFVTIYAI